MLSSLAAAVAFTAPSPAARLTPQRARITMEGDAPADEAPVVEAPPPPAPPAATKASYEYTKGDFAPPAATAGVAGLKSLAFESNPALGYWNPLKLGELEAWDDEDAVVGWLRHAELKHGRVAMAGFVGFCVQSNGISWPWPLQGGAFGGETIQFADIAAAGGPGDQWDALPSSAKLQIIIFVGFLESLGEDPRFLPDGKHYTRGGRPGTFPSLKKLNEVEGSYVPHPVPFDLFDPFGFQKRMSPERKAKALIAELNNGRLAMVGLMGLLSVSKGLKVPVLDTFAIAPYKGEYMAPFSATDTLPFVKDMVEASSAWGWSGLGYH